MKRTIIAVLALAIAALVAPSAQLRVVPIDEEQGHVALGLALRHLANTGIFMQATAHPDDEDNALLVMLNRGQGIRTTLATATRGNGGQNEIGPEIFEALGVLRTEELNSMHRFDGAEQYFTHAVDFGYSFSIEETLQKWGHDEILSDYVRLIRMIRPDVMTGMNTEGVGGGLHHQTSGILSHEAYTIAGDATKYPDQLKDGLRPWHPKKFYFAAGFGNASQDAGKQLTVNLAGYDPLLGRTYSEIGSEARSMHKCQMMTQLIALPGPATRGYRLTESTIAGETQKDERSVFDGVDTSIAALAQYAGQKPPRELTDGLSAIATAVQNAQKRFDADTADDSVVAPLVGGLRSLRTLRGQLRNLPIDETGRFEIDFRLRQKEREFQQAIMFAEGVRIDALADDGVVVPGQNVKLSLTVANRGGADVTVKSVKFDGFDGTVSCALAAVGPAGPGGGGRGRGAAAPPAVPVSTLHKDQAARCDPVLKVPANARTSEPYWHRADDAGRYTFDADAPFGLPYRPTPFYVQVTFEVAGAGAPEEIIDGLPVVYRYEDIVAGEKRSELLVVPAYSVRVTPEVAIIPEQQPMPAPAPAATQRPAGRGVAAGRGSATPPPARGRGVTPPAPATVAQPPSPPPPPSSREIRVTVINDSKGPAENMVVLDLPQGWRALPPEQPVKFTREDEAQTVRFQVVPPTGVRPGDYHVKAIVKVGDASYARGYQVIEYPHIRRQHIYHEADVTLKVLDVKTAPNLSVGYIMGAGDEVPAVFEQLGAKVQMLQTDDLAWGDLSRFNTIVTGIRAYERRADLRANNSRLLDYVQNGGTLIVQYNRDPFNNAQYGPYPARVTADRITDEFAPVTITDPSNPLFNTPNKITDAVWKGWVQERGIQFLSDHDSRYRDLLEMEDPFPNNRGVKHGALVEATYGKGRWVYVGLVLWRELAAGVDGAYPLMANLISLGKQP
jgi:LmbE family N-acetylglucosaminyl deacetylase